MKLSIQRNLLSQTLKRINCALLKSKDPTEIAQYISLTATEQNLITLINRRNMLAKITLDTQTLDGMLTVSATGTQTVDGTRLCDLIASSAVENKIEIEFNKAKEKSQEKQEDVGHIKKEIPEEKTTVEEVGSLNVISPGAKGKKDVSKFPCLNIQLEPKVSVDGEFTLKIKGGEFIRYVKSLSSAIGDNTMQAIYSNILLRVVENKLEMAAYNGGQFCLVNLDVESKKNMECLVPYDLLTIVANMCDPEKDIMIFHGGKESQNIVFTQEFTYGGMVVGKMICRTVTTEGKYFNYNKIVKSLDFKHSCKVKRQEFKAVCSHLDNLDFASTMLNFNSAPDNPDEQLITFEKKNNINSEIRHLNIYEPKGDPIVLEVSSRHLSIGSNLAKEEEFELKFSGVNSLALMDVNPNLKYYFQPFGGK